MQAYDGRNLALEREAEHGPHLLQGVSTWKVERSVSGKPRRFHQRSVAAAETECAGSSSGLPPRTFSANLVRPNRERGEKGALLCRTYPCSGPGAAFQAQQITNPSAHAEQQVRPTGESHFAESEVETSPLRKIKFDPVSDHSDPCRPT